MYFIVDYSTVEIGAIDKHFDDITVYICDFHRLQVMQRRSKGKKHSLTAEEHKMFLSQMQNVSFASTKSEYNAEVTNLQKSGFYEKVKNTLKHLAFAFVALGPYV